MNIEENDEINIDTMTNTIVQISRNRIFIYDISEKNVEDKIETLIQKVRHTLVDMYSRVEEPFDAASEATTANKISTDMSVLSDLFHELADIRKREGETDEK